ncbi:ribonuclease T2 family protein [Sphingomonas elodea]|uniref:ribonuclease T2 family protein n=1 Tax=Sphingomonas elodea TaxID=179878 RepID=UPI0002630911|nr:ribonuclease T [Sphingomonas elodea]
MKTMVAGLGLSAAMLPGAACAQAEMCVVPRAVERPLPDLPSAKEPRRVLPISSYTLALTWTPGFCRANGDSPGNRFRCSGENRFGFTLHGLWPDAPGKTWPQYCTSTPILRPALIRKTMCATPSAQLIQHEWAKHGTCMRTTPAAYFQRSTGLYRAIRYPDMEALLRGAPTVGDFKQAFAAHNRAIPASAIRVTTTREGWLDELWLCLDTRFRYHRCEAGTGGAADDAPLKIWRGR